MTNGSRQTVTVKLKPFLQEFLRCTLNDDAAEASRKTLIGAILAPLVQYAPKDYVHKRNSGPDHITFELPNHLGGKNSIRNAVVISEKNQREFERILNRYFNDIFFNYIEDKIRYNAEIKNVILQFCADYHISFNEINYEMLKKRHYRRKKALKKREKFTPKLSLKCPLIFLL